jgi:hypothetical protein
VAGPLWSVPATRGEVILAAIVAAAAIGLLLVLVLAAVI